MHHKIDVYDFEFELIKKICLNILQNCECHLLRNKEKLCYNKIDTKLKSEIFLDKDE